MEKQGGKGLILIDTDVWIDFMDAKSKFHEKAREVVEKLRHTKGVISTLLITEVNTGYYAVGSSGKARDFVAELKKIRNLKICDVSVEIADKAAELKAKYGIETPDAIIGATAALNKVETLYTRNLRHFLPLSKEGIKIAGLE